MRTAKALTTGSFTKQARPVMRNCNAIDAPEEHRPVLRDGYDQPQVAEVGIEAAGISSVIWAAGYRFDFGLVKLAVTDGDGFPLQQRGVTACPGLYFVVMPACTRRSPGCWLA